MRTRHVRVNGSTLHFHFQGKSRKEHVLDVRNPRLARAVKRCQDLPGHELFQYVDDDGQRRAIDSADVNDYLRSITGENFTAKDFRTWHGTVRAADALAAAHEAESEAEAKRQITAAIQVAADHLGNTPAICRKSYVHPAIIESYQDGSLFSTWHQIVAEARSGATLGLEPEEIAVLAILQQRLEADQSENQAVA